jgi:uncharacterized Tic20 family protein
MMSAHDSAQNGPHYVLRSPSLGERLIAALTHLLMLASLPGFIITGLVVILSRSGSPYIKHHARAALRWQLFETLLTLVLLGGLIAVIVGSGLLGSKHEGDALNVAFLATGGIFLVFAIPAAVFAIPAVVGAARALLSGHFRYPVTPVTSDATTTPSR